MRFFLTGKSGKFFHFGPTLGPSHGPKKSKLGQTKNIPREKLPEVSKNRKSKSEHKYGSEPAPKLPFHFTKNAPMCGWVKIFFAQNTRSNAIKYYTTNWKSEISTSLNIKNEQSHTQTHTAAHIHSQALAQPGVENDNFLHLRQQISKN